MNNSYISDLKSARSKYTAYKDAGAQNAKEASGITRARSNAAMGGISTGINIGGAALTGFVNNAKINTGAADSSKSQSTALLGQNWNNTSTTGLMNQWNSTQFAPHVTWQQLRGSKLQGATNILGSAMSGASAGSAAGPWGMAAGAVTGLGTGLAGWFSGKKKAKRLARATNMLADVANNRIIDNMHLNAQNIQTGMIDQYNRNWVAYGGDLNAPYITGPAEYDIINTQQRISEKKAGLNNIGLANLNSLGGTLLSNGGNYNLGGLTHVDEGGSHEDNPEGGVRMGSDNQGVPNFVEEGESIFKNYVFSDRLTIPTFKNKKNVKAKGGKLKESVPYEELVLKPYQGLTFSEAAKKIEKAIYGEGGNINGKQRLQYTNEKDKKDTLEATLSVLAQVQEQLKQQEEARQLQEAIAQMSPEELQALQQQIAMMQQQEMQQQQDMQQQAMQEQQMAQPQVSPEQMAAMEQQQPIMEEQPQMTPEEAAALEQQQIAMQQQPMEGYACGGRLHADGGNLEGNYFSGGGKFITINDNKYEITPEGKLINVDTKSPIYKNENDWPIYYNLIYGHLLQDENGHYFLNDNKDALAEVKGLSNMSIPGIEEKKLWDRDEEVLKYLWSLPQEDIDNLLTYGYSVNSEYNDFINTKDENAEDESIKDIKGESARAKIKELRDIIRNQYASDLDEIKKEQKELKKVESRAKKRLNVYYKKKGVNPETLKGYAKQQYETDIQTLMEDNELLEKDPTQKLNINRYSSQGKLTQTEYNRKANKDGITNRYRNLGATEYQLADNNRLDIPVPSTSLGQYLNNPNIANGVIYDPDTKQFLSGDTPLSYEDLQNIKNLVQFDENPFSSQEELTDYYRDKLLQRYQALNKGGQDFDWTSDNVLDRTKPFYLNSSELQDFITNLNTSDDPKDKALATMLQNSSIDGKESPIYMEMLGQSLGLSRANNESDENYFNRIKEEDTKRFNPPANRNSDSYWGQDHPPFLINNGKIYRMRLPNGDNTFEDVWLPYNLDGVDYSNAIKSEDGAKFVGENFGNIDVYDLGPQNLDFKIERVGNPNDGYRYFSIDDNRAKSLNFLDPNKIKDLPTWEAPKGYTGNIQFYENLQKDPNVIEENKTQPTNKAYPTPGADFLGPMSSLIGGIGALLPPDYSRANAMLTRGYFTPHIAPERIPDPTRPKFVDPENQTRLIAQQTATTQGNIKNSGTNQGSKNAALTAAGHQGQVNQANALIAGIQANNALENQWYQQFQGTRHANQSAQLEADRANQQAFRAGDQMIAQGYGLAEQIDQNRARALSQNAQNILNNYYRDRAERYGINQANWYLLNSGIPYLGLNNNRQR